MKAQKAMPIVMYLGRNVKEYIEKSEEIVSQALSDGKFRCEYCLRQMQYHSSYTREVKETGQKLKITIVWCRKCKKWHSLQPDFMLPHKHYSGNEIESVIIDSAIQTIAEIETEASDSTVRRWIKQMGERITQATSKLKYLFSRSGQMVSELMIDGGHCYSELEQVLEKAPRDIKCSGNKLGLANIWLRTTVAAGYI
jgi:hypothetical protein